MLQPAAPRTFAPFRRPALAPRRLDLDLGRLPTHGSPPACTASLASCGPAGATKVVNGCHIPAAGPAQGAGAGPEGCPPTSQEVPVPLLHLPPTALRCPGQQDQRPGPAPAPAHSRQGAQGAANPAVRSTMQLTPRGSTALMHGSSEQHASKSRGGSARPRPHLASKHPAFPIRGPGLGLRPPWLHCSHLYTLSAAPLGPGWPLIGVPLAAPPGTKRALRP